MSNGGDSGRGPIPYFMGFFFFLVSVAWWSLAAVSLVVVILKLTGVKL